MSTTFVPSSLSPLPLTTSLTAERATRARKPAMRRQRSAKIVATLGPASSSPAMLRTLFDAGVEVFRCNFSHGTHDDHRQLFTAIRRIEHDTGRPIGILADLQGPKLRLGDFADGRVRLPPGARFRLDLDDRLGDEHRAPLPHPGG